MKQQRKIKPTRCSVSGKIPYKGKVIAYESTLERDFLLQHTFHGDVVDIVAQPVQIDFEKHGRVYTYTPDFFVDFSLESGLKSMLVEVKPKALWQANWREWSDKWKATMKYCQEHNLVFHIYDETRIRDQMLDNINMLMRYKNFAIDGADTNAILAQVTAMGDVTIDYLLTRFYSGYLKEHGWRVILCLLANKKLQTYLSEPINEFSIVWRGEL